MCWPPGVSDTNGLPGNFAAKIRLSDVFVGALWSGTSCNMENSRKILTYSTGRVLYLFGKLFHVILLSFLYFLYFSLFLTIFLSLYSYLSIYLYFLLWGSNLVNCELVFSNWVGIKKWRKDFSLKKIVYWYKRSSMIGLYWNLVLGWPLKASLGSALVGPSLRQVIGEITQKQWN